MKIEELRLIVDEVKKVLNTKNSVEKFYALMLNKFVDHLKKPFTILVNNLEKNILENEIVINSFFD